MSHSYAQNLVHLVFSTKDRAKSITPPLRPKLHAYIVGICNNDGIIVHAIGGAQDHIHCLLQIPPTHSVAKTVLTIKANSSRWLRQTSRDFAWQQGYAAFSVSASMILTVSRYIQNQEAHHHKMTFQEEFLALLRRHRVEYDPKFVLG
ncbi:MAG TPA: IS200/IS605 family transposase [Candidatus Acidoferrum sp.]|jgi:REP element-mobilizing transposase RayT|nr:IS200/IS605 family transposase [Candidatus Acidoferrum sp.]